MKTYWGWRLYFDIYPRGLEGVGKFKKQGPPDQERDNIVYIYSVQHWGSDAWRFDFVRVIFDDNTFVDCGSGNHNIDDGDSVLVACQYN